jgi:hypothetical protein
MPATCPTPYHPRYQPLDETDITRERRSPALTEDQSASACVAAVTPEAGAIRPGVRDVMRLTLTIGKAAVTQERERQPRKQLRSRRCRRTTVPSFLGRSVR